jgi:hypothetical protein
MDSIMVNWQKNFRLRYYSSQIFEILVLLRKAAYNFTCKLADAVTKSSATVSIPRSSHKSAVFQ